MISEMLLMALITVESGGNDFTVGDSGKAAGCLQIHKEVIEDVNRIYGTTYRWPQSCYSRETSKEICRMYLKHYAPKRAKAKMISRIWNGGPKGHKKQATLKYWKKVKLALKK
jgi:hypothetical protein